MNQIERLQENLKRWGFLSNDDKLFMKQIPCSSIILLDDRHGEWEVKPPVDAFFDDTIYQIIENYTPEPDKIEVRMIRGDGYISPVSQSSIEAHIKEIDGKEYVSVKALEYANKSIANAEYWLKELGVWGDNETVKKIYKLVHPEWGRKEPEPDKPDFPGYVLCEVKQDEEGDWVFEDSYGLYTYLDEAARLGCCGYVYKENYDTIQSCPNMWVSKNGVLYDAWEDGLVPASYKYVAFKEAE